MLNLSERGEAARRRVYLQVEELERREVPAVLTPAQVRHAYGFDQVSFTYQGQTVKGDGSGQTIAIVNAYGSSKIFSDADAFSRSFSINGGSQTLYQQYGAASSWLTVATPQGKPGTDSTGLWALESSLDVEWAHAIAPGAKILLVEAKSNSFADLTAAASYAKAQPGVVVVSMSWGSPEFSTEASYDAIFTTPAGHLGGSNGKGGARLAGGVSFVAASGDSGTPGLWPAASVNVLAVGGTTLKVDTAGNYQSETAWKGSGGSVSKYEAKPAYQQSLAYAKRSLPDVSYNADTASGFYVYHTLPVSGRTATWWSVGGTSAAAPQWAALVAIVDQGRALQGLGSLDGPGQLLPAIYKLPSTDFHDVKSGSNGLLATTGYDLVTGRGTPYANLVIRDLIKTGPAPFVTSSATPGSTGTSPLPKFNPNASPNSFFQEIVTPAGEAGASWAEGLRPRNQAASWIVSARPAARKLAPMDWDLGSLFRDWFAEEADQGVTVRKVAQSSLDEFFSAWLVEDISG